MVAFEYLIFNILFFVLFSLTLILKLLNTKSKLVNFFEAQNISVKQRTLSTQENYVF